MTTNRTNENPWLTGHHVELPEMLDGREYRAFIQRELLKTHKGTLVCFTLNIAGPIKVFPLGEETFEDGCRHITRALTDAGLEIEEEHAIKPPYGWEAYFCLNAPCMTVKRVLTELEETHPLGRLFDIDVLNSEGEKASRQELGYPPRTCLICGNTATECARSRSHTVGELQDKTLEMMLSYWKQKPLTDHMVGRISRMALLREVYTTPKPGLVDLRNSGSHRDMDVALFETSSAVLEEYFARCFSVGKEQADKYKADVSKVNENRAYRTETDESKKELSNLLQYLRPLGIEAEKAMFQATGGINTHKGMIFSLGIICGTLGWMYGSGLDPEESDFSMTLLKLAGTVAAPALTGDLASGSASGVTAGERQYLEYGLSGIRGEAAGGFASIREVGLPCFRSCLEKGLDFRQAGVQTLLRLIQNVTDSNMIARVGLEKQKCLRKEVEQLLAGDRIPSREEVEALDDRFILENASPGGCADLLAITYFLYFLEQLQRK